MPNRRLSKDELIAAGELLTLVRTRLQEMSAGDEALLWAIRRKVFKELMYDERGKPRHRRRLKALKRSEQGGLCKVCGKELPETYVVLDRLEAMRGYTPENTRLIHQDCDVGVQRLRGYS